MTERQALRTFGKRLRELRHARGWTQEQLAEAANLHENFISRLENGRQEPALFVLLRLCIALNVTPGELLADLTLPAQTTAPRHT